ncbi:MAG: tryptophan synthase subunit alpha [SAR202 cluster bacterium Casp-Chloro-G4]|nr:MAG: tryptophan synthase subunit alpha [SAR202 cluster bacterium Casp-Chloro-G4]
MTNRIDEKLGDLKKAGATALVPFVTVGFPDVATSEQLAKAVLEAGGDMLELGVPFSDPVADGPTVQMTSFRALEQGANLNTAISMVSSLRRDGVDSPLIFMGYLNPFLHHGFEQFAKDASEAGLDGIIIPDLPPEEAELYIDILEKQGIYLIPLLAPTSTAERIAQACKRAKGFIYCVSITGVTGARQTISGGVSELVSAIRMHTDLPILVGFGVSTREHVEAIGQFADGAVVASAMLNAIDEAPLEQAVQVAKDFIKSLRGTD